jgi:ABC-2 type transport system ATP-binding protein
MREAGSAVADPILTGEMRAETPAISVIGLTKSYRKVVAVAGIGFSVQRGAIVGLLGGNGAGKTTTIGMIMGLVLPSSGTAKVLGVDMARERHLVLHRINFGSPYVEMPKRLTVRQNLRVFGTLYNVRGIAERIDVLAAELDLADLLDLPSGELSAGQKTRVSLAKSLINSPDVLLLDEPTASLDPDTADWVRSRLERYRMEQRATILLASHNMPEVERLCDEVLMMKAGKIVDQGAPADLIARYGRENMEEVFLDVARDRRKRKEAAE